MINKKIDLINKHTHDSHLINVRMKRLVFLYKNVRHVKHIEERREDYELAKIKRDGAVVLSLEFVD